ncbi:hypothetical protein L596_016801 [Steinernema carpocapsae]|uniref:Peroxisomal biogenesis factor 3 n=1 Tax=Steinernema carpocapsae TaxID=34508 RepID=A0A4U5NKK2_STECR|nr:hypothetical protein L596_016801 [Steinernema carpocapsae]
MDAAWKAYDFVKRNRGKLLVAGTAVGAVVIAQKIYENRQQREEAAHQNVVVSSARREYIFDSNHRSCESKIIELIPCVKNVLENYFNVEYLVSMLNNNSLTKTEKFEIWEKMKIMAVARVVVTAYTFTALVQVMKCQMSIVSAGIYLTMKQSAVARDSGWLSYLPEVISSQFITSDTSSASGTTSHTSQEVFLRCIEYFTSTGISQLCESIYNHTSDVIKTVDLMTPVSTFEIHEKLAEILSRLQDVDLAHYVVPSFGSNSDNAALTELLSQLTTVMQREAFKDNLKTSMDEFLDVAMSVLNGVTQEAEKKPFAKMIPLIADSYYKAASTEFDAPVQKCICSSELHRLTKDIFKENIAWTERAVHKE